METHLNFTLNKTRMRKALAMTRSEVEKQRGPEQRSPGSQEKAQDSAAKDGREHLEAASHFWMEEGLRGGQPAQAGKSPETLLSPVFASHLGPTGTPALVNFLRGRACL